MEISDRIRSERKRMELTQADLGKIGGVSEITQRNYEAGRSVPDANYFHAVAGVIDIVYVITGKLADIKTEPFDEDEYNALIAQESRADYASSRNTYSSKIALKAADRLAKYSSEFDIPQELRLSCYELIYMSLYMQEFADQEPVFLDEAVKVMSQSAKTA